VLFPQREDHHYNTQKVGNVTMASCRKTSKAAASAASKVLRSNSTSKMSKTAAGSALSQAAPKRKK